MVFMAVHMVIWYITAKFELKMQYENDDGFYAYLTKAFPSYSSMIIAIDELQISQKETILN